MRDTVRLVATLRRLPVLQTKADEDVAAETRAPWQWVLVGAGLVATAWLPLAVLALPFWPAAVLGAFCVACVGGGACVGRFGGRARAREAAAAGVGASSVVWVVAALGGALTPWPLALAALGALVASSAPLGYVGGRIGERARPKI